MVIKMDNVTANEQYNSLVQEIHSLKAQNTALIEKVNDLTGEIAALKEMKQTSNVGNANMEEMFRRSDDFVHKENVKVYRNVQAVVIEENEKQISKVRSSMEGMANKLCGSSRRLNVISILILIAVLLNLAGTILNCLNTYLF